VPAADGVAFEWGIVRFTLFLAAVLLAACSSARFDGTAMSPVRQAPPFTLTDQSGHAWSLDSQRGERVALYFGYTHCPDDCPLTLAKLSHAIAELGSNGKNSEIAFVTVDPARDTPAVLAAYIARFHGARIVGLTGSRTALARVYRAYDVWAQRIPGASPSHGYDVSHASPVFLIDSAGRLRVVHDDDDPRSAFVHDLRLLGA
jgi:protein SCO1/2